MTKHRNPYISRRMEYLFLHSSGTSISDPAIAFHIIFLSPENNRGIIRAASAESFVPSIAILKSSNVLK
jgi:hypothetical protein